jgi:hypothetical protein
MNPPELAQAPTVSRTAKLLPPAAGIAVAGVVAFSAASPPTHYSSWTTLLVFALERIFSVSMSCVLTSAILCAIVFRNAGLDHHVLLVQASRAAIWFAPVALLIRTNSSWTLLAVAVFAVLVTPSLRIGEGDVPNPEHSLLSSLHSDTLPLFPKFRPEICIAAALCAQTGAVAFFAGHPKSGALLVGLACCAWTWWSVSNTELQNSQQAQSYSMPLTLVAVLFTVAALLPYLQGATGIGLGSSHKYAARIVSGDHESRRQQVAQILDESARTAGDGNSGIILWPEKQLRATLVAPPPLDLRTHGLSSAENPLTIPFDGVYWFFKAPDIRPPKTSRQAQASPDVVEIRSTDRRPLSIEAHDHLGNLINTDCCSRIQIAIRNADRYPDTVSLELILIDTSNADKPSESLGTMLVKSTRPWGIYEHPRPVNETLSFPISARASLRHFDELKIVFRLDRARADAAARIAIDHFVLIPRGM